MAIVTGGLGLPEEGALVAGGLGAGVAAPPGSIYALLSGSGSIVGGVVALGHLAASLSGAGDVTDADLIDGAAGGTHTYGGASGVTVSTGVVVGVKHSSGGASGSTTSTGHAGLPPAPAFPDILPTVFGISLDPDALYRKRRTRGGAVGACASTGSVRGVARRGSSVRAATASTGTARGYSQLVNDDDEVMLLLGYLTPVG